MQVRMTGYQMVALEIATRQYRRRLDQTDRARLDYHRKKFLKLVLDSDVIEPPGYNVKPGTTTIEFTPARLYMILDVAKMAQRDRIYVSPRLDKAITILENANNDYARRERISASSK